MSKKRVKRPMTEEMMEEIIYSLNFIWLSAYCIDAEHTMWLKDTNFGIPLIHNFANRIKKDAEAIRKMLKVAPIDEDKAEERMLELHRAIKFFSDKNTEELRAFNDKVEQDTRELMKVS